MIRIKPETPAKKPARPVTKSRKIKPRNTPEKGGDRRTGTVKAPSPPPVMKVPRGRRVKMDAEAFRETVVMGRPKVHATAADRQRAYRERQKEAKL